MTASLNDRLDERCKLIGQDYVIDSSGSQWKRLCSSKNLASVVVYDKKQSQAQKGGFADAGVQLPDFRCLSSVLLGSAAIINEARLDRFHDRAIKCELS